MEPDLRFSALSCFLSHRFTKSQQDIFLPFVERGTITLIGATTENPSFRVNSALLSRCRVLTLEKLSLKDGMDKMIRRAARIKWRDILDMACEQMTDTELATLNSTFGQNDQTLDEWVDAKTDPGAIKWLIDLSDGDGIYRCIFFFFLPVWFSKRCQFACVHGLIDPGNYFTRFY